MHAAPQPQALSPFTATTFNPDGEIVEFITFPGTPQEFFIVDPLLENPLHPNFGAIKVGAVLTRGVLVTRDNRPGPPPPNNAGPSGFRDRPGAVENQFVPTGFNVGRVFASYNPKAYNGEGAYFLAMDVSAPGAMDNLSGTQPVAFDVDGNGSRFTQTEIADPNTVSEAPKADEDRYSISIDVNGDGIPEIKVNIIERRSAIRAGGILIDPAGGPQMIDGVLVRRSVFFEDRTGLLPGDPKSQAVQFLDANDDGMIDRNDFGVGADIELAIRDVRNLPRMTNPSCVTFSFTADSFDDEPLGGGAEELVRLAATFPVPDIEASKKVRCVGDSEFTNQVRAAPGSDVEFQVRVQNLGNLNLDVAIDDVPSCIGRATLTPVAASCQVTTAPAGFDSAEFCANFHEALGMVGGFPLSIGTLRAGDACAVGLGEQLVFTFRARVGPESFESTLCDNDIDCRNGISVSGVTSVAFDPILAPFTPTDDSPDGNSEEEDCQNAACCVGIPGCVPNDGIGDVRDEFNVTVVDVAGVIDTERERTGSGDDNVANVEIECRGITLTKEVQILPDGRFVTGLEGLQAPSAPVDIGYRYRVVNNGEQAETVTITEGALCDDIAALQSSFPGQVSFISCPICTGPTPGRVSGPAAAGGGAFESSCGIRFGATGEPALTAFMRADDGRPACRATTPQGGSDDSCYRNCAQAGAVITNPSGICSGGEIRAESFATVCHQICSMTVTKQAQCLDDCTRRNPTGSLLDTLPITKGSCMQFQVSITNTSADDSICLLRIADTLSNQPADVLFDGDARFRIGNTNCTVPAGFNVNGAPFNFSPATDCATPGGLAPNQTLTITFKARIPNGANRTVSPTNVVTVDGASFCPTAGPSFTCRGTADAVLDILEPRLTCDGKNWEIQPDTDGDCDPDGPFRPGGDEVDLSDALFPVLLKFTVQVSNPGDVAVSATASDNLLANCVANTPGVSIASPPACELGTPKQIQPGGVGTWVCQLLVDSSDAMRALAACDGTADDVFVNNPSVSATLVVGQTGLCASGSLSVDCPGELDTPVLAPPECAMTVRKQVKCKTDSDETYADDLVALPNSMQSFRIQVQNDSEDVRLLQVCLTDTLGCDEWLVGGSVQASINGSNVTSCFLPEFPAALVSGARVCYTFNECRPATPWIAPGETLTITFDVAVPVGFVQQGQGPACQNVIQVDAYDNACEENPPANAACVTGTDQAEFDVRTPSLDCDKVVCPDANVDGLCDRDFDDEVNFPANLRAPFSVFYRLTYTNTGLVPLENVKICDPQLPTDAIAAGITILGCQLNGGGGCSMAGNLGPGESISIGCRLFVPSRAAWIDFAGRDDDNDPDCYSNLAAANGTAGGTDVCDGGTPLRVDSLGCGSRVCVPPPPRGACCRTDGTCTESIEEECTEVGNTYLGNGTTCRGDENGNGIDDACEEPIPTVSEWGVVILALLLLTTAKLYFRDRPEVQA